jgi:hypothetical protein
VIAPPPPHNYYYLKSSRDGIPKSTISLRFLGIVLRFLRLDVSTFVFAFLQNVLEVSPLIDCFVWISETIQGADDKLGQFLDQGI